MLKRTFRLLLICTLFLSSASWAQTTTATDDTLMNPELLWKLGRLGAAEISADGKTAFYTVRNYELKENSGTTDLFVVDLQSGKSRKILENWASIGNVQFGDSPFGERIFMKARERVQPSRTT